MIISNAATVVALALAASFSSRAATVPIEVRADDYDARRGLRLRRRDAATRPERVLLAKDLGDDEEFIEKSGTATGTPEDAEPRGPTPSSASVTVEAAAAEVSVEVSAADRQKEDAPPTMMPPTFECCVADEEEDGYPSRGLLMLPECCADVSSAENAEELASYLDRNAPRPCCPPPEDFACCFPDDVESVEPALSHELDINLAKAIAAVDTTKPKREYVGFRAPACCDDYLVDGSSEGPCCEMEVTPQKDITVENLPLTFECCSDGGEDSPKCCAAMEDTTNVTEYLDKHGPCCDPAKKFFPNVDDDNDLPPTFECCLGKEDREESSECCKKMGQVMKDGNVTQYLDENGPCCRPEQALRCCFSEDQLLKFEYQDQDRKDHRDYDYKDYKNYEDYEGYQYDKDWSQFPGHRFLPEEEEEGCCAGYLAGDDAPGRCCPPPPTFECCTDENEGTPECCTKMDHIAGPDDLVLFLKANGGGCCDVPQPVQCCFSEFAHGGPPDDKYQPRPNPNDPKKEFQARMLKGGGDYESQELRIKTLGVEGDWPDYGACCESYVHGGNSTGRCCPPPPTFECCSEGDSPQCCSALDDLFDLSDLLDYLEDNGPCCPPPPTFECCAASDKDGDYPECCLALANFTSPADDVFEFLNQNKGQTCCVPPQEYGCCFPWPDEENGACCKSYLARDATEPCCDPPTTTSSTSSITVAPTTAAATSTAATTTATTTAATTTTATSTTMTTTTTTTLPLYNVIRNPGSVSINGAICGGTPEEIDSFARGFVASIVLATAREVDIALENVVICGQRATLELANDLGRRRLRDGPWMVDYDLVTKTICRHAGCASEQDIANADAIADSVADTVRVALESGSFSSLLRANADVAAALPGFDLNCLAAWGTMHEATTTLVDISGDPVASDNVAANAAFAYYPDWEEYSGTCLRDGREPLYMKNAPTDYLFDTLESCCDEHYAGWNKALCMDNKGSGMWYVHYSSGKCRTDCEEGGGGTCGGLANPVSDSLYANPIDCCESELHWIFPQWCEADSLEIDCYCGTGKYYRGGAGEVCVKDCHASCSGGDVTCGGIVETADVKLHESASSCCAEYFDWIDNELCAVRTDAIEIDKYWPDKSSSKCFKDSETPATDLSVSLYSTLEECCAEIWWVGISDCL